MGLAPTCTDSSANVAGMRVLCIVVARINSGMKHCCPLILGKRSHLNESGHLNSKAFIKVLHSSLVLTHSSRQGLIVVDWEIAMEHDGKKAVQRKARKNDEQFARINGRKERICLSAVPSVFLLIVLVFFSPEPAQIDGRCLHPLSLWLVDCVIIAGIGCVASTYRVTLSGFVELDITSFVICCVTGFVSGCVTASVMLCGTDSVTISVV